MPIKLSKHFEPISYDDFHSLDYDVMGIVFSIHWELGRFLKEKIYQNELAYRCQKAGFKNVATEVEIDVSYKDFHKVYYIDLLINNAVYELKTAQELGGEHEKQTINYLMLTGLTHAKLINLRTPSVQYRFQDYICDKRRKILWKPSWSIYSIYIAKGNSLDKLKS